MMMMMMMMMMRIEDRGYDAIIASSRLMNESS